MAITTFDHVALLVTDLDSAIRDYGRLLEVLDPKQVQGVVLDQSLVDGHLIRWATFSKGSSGSCIQLIQSSLPRDRKLLSRRGECVHHIAFCSSDVRETSTDLVSAGIPVLHREPVQAADRPWLAWNFVAPSRAHGVLVEVSQQYRVEGAHWVKG